MKEITIESSNCKIYDSANTICNDFASDGGYVFNGIIYGHKNSTAEKYAKKYGYNFKIIGDSNNYETMGDCNNDGQFSVADILMLQKWLLNDETELTNWQSADLDENGIIDVFDLCLMKQELINK